MVRPRCFIQIRFNDTERPELNSLNLPPFDRDLALKRLDTGLSRCPMPVPCMHACTGVCARTGTPQAYSHAVVSIAASGRCHTREYHDCRPPALSPPCAALRPFRVAWRGSLEPIKSRRSGAVASGEAESRSGHRQRNTSARCNAARHRSEAARNVGSGSLCEWTIAGNGRRWLAGEKALNLLRQLITAFNVHQAATKERLHVCSREEFRC